MGLDGGLPAENRRLRACHSAQRQSLQWPYVSPANPQDGKPLTREYAQARAQFEPLIEATQIKGDGETHPFLSSTDEFANFERWDFGNLGGPEPKTQSMFEFDFPLRPQERPEGRAERRHQSVQIRDDWQHGFHTSLAAVEEDNFFGNSAKEPSAERAERVMVDFGPGRPSVKGWQMTSSGYAAVWATENTREAIFDAMMRKEVYATTGSRMIVRFFGGFEFEPKDAQTRSPAVVGYTKGVPMGGDLKAPPAGKGPTFLVAALKDPIGANLDRIQIVKGWMDAKGEVAGDEKSMTSRGAVTAGPAGTESSVGSTVDVANATWTNTIGATELITVWSDPNFDPAERAFYYARVIEIPTPRWTAYDAKYFRVNMPKELPMTTTERAYTAHLVYALSAARAARNVRNGLEADTNGRRLSVGQCQKRTFTSIQKTAVRVQSAVSAPNPDPIDRTTPVHRCARAHAHTRRTDAGGRNSTGHRCGRKHHSRARHTALWHTDIFAIDDRRVGRLNVCRQHECCQSKNQR